MERVIRERMTLQAQDMEVVTPQAVSYTHLDVYKRQGCVRRAAGRRNGCGEARNPQPAGRGHPGARAAGGRTAAELADYLQALKDKKT